MEKNIITKNDLVNGLFYLLFFIVYTISLTFFSMGEDGSKVRYYMLAISCFMGFLMLIKSKKIMDIKNMKGKRLLYVIIVVFLFLFVSLQKVKALNVSLNIRTYVQTSLLLLPALYAFLVLNLFNTKSIINLMKITTIILIFGYLLEDGHQIVDFFNINNWLNISIFKSISFTESSLYSEPFLQLFLFFNFARNLLINNKNIEKINIYYYVSMIFTILSFKRLALVFVIFILIIDKFYDKASNTKFKYAILLSIFITIITIYYTKFMRGEIFTNVDVYNFSTGRNYILSLWEKRNFYSYGYGTSMLVIGRYLEMDLVEVYLELGIICLFAFNMFFCIQSKDNKYCTIIVLYSLGNMLTASLLPSLISTFLLLLVLNFISEQKYREDNYLYQRRKKYELHDD